MIWSEINWSYTFSKWILWQISSNRLFQRSLGSNLERAQTSELCSTGPTWPHFFPKYTLKDALKNMAPKPCGFQGNWYLRPYENLNFQYRNLNSWRKRLNTKPIWPEKERKKSRIRATLGPLVYVWFKSTDTIPWV